jgi:hypothetical protein
LLGLTALALVTLAASPATAQEYSLFDKFSVGFALNQASHDTRIRLDSKIVGIGTEIDLEDDLGLDDSQTIPTLRLDWRMKKRQRLYFSWASYGRSARSTASRDITIGDLVIPVDATVDTDYDFDDVRLGYAYYVLLKDRSALGLSGGFRALDYKLAVSTTIDVGGGITVSEREDGDASGPFPFVGMEYRYGITPKWRLVSELGWFSVKLGDLEGSQLLLDARIEHLFTQRFAWGLRAALGEVDLNTESDEWRGKVDQDIAGVEVFIRARW